MKLQLLDSRNTGLQIFFRILFLPVRLIPFKSFLKGIEREPALSFGAIFRTESTGNPNGTSFSHVFSSFRFLATVWGSFDVGGKALLGCYGPKLFSRSQSKTKISCPHLILNGFVVEALLSNRRTFLAKMAKFWLKCADT